MKSFVAISLMSLALAGCSSGLAEVGFDDKPPAPKVNITADTFCRQTSEATSEAGVKQFSVSWTESDSIATAQKVENLGAKYSRVCEKKVDPPPLK